MEKVKRGSTEYISNIDYNARGQRTDVYYGNNSKTAYTYDIENFRLTRLLTTKNSGQVILQDLNYIYDSVGNILEIEDNAQQTVYFNNSVIDPVSTYEYDALYRLLEATGREKGGLNSAPTQADLAIVSPVPHNNQSNDVSNYTQTFEYDKLGNILNMCSQNKWSRNYFYDTATNQLQKHDEFGQNEYTYDAHGNMLSMPEISEMVWDFGDKLNKTISGTVTSFYNYDSGGERTRKVVLKQGGIREERYYINGYEVYRKFISNVIDTERQTLHIADESKRFAIIDTLNIENGISLGTTDVTIRYQYDNHLGSASLELDEFANIISYEEYHPFGTSSYRLGTNEAEVQLKRYRYVGKESDEETGLYYFGARYYAGWIGRWISVYPLKEKYLNLTPYNYCANNPIYFTDSFGDTLDIDNSAQARIDIENLAGEYSNLLTFSDAGRVGIDWGKAPERVLKSERRMERFKRKALRDEGFALISDLVGDEYKFLYGTEGPFDFSGYKEGGDFPMNYFSNISGENVIGQFGDVLKDFIFSASITEYGVDLEGIKQKTILPKPGYHGQVVIAPGTPSLFLGMESYQYWQDEKTLIKETKPIEITSRSDVVKHELRENWFRTAKGMNYIDAHNATNEMYFSFEITKFITGK